MQQAPPELRHHVKAVFAQLRRSRGFMDSLPGHLPGDAASQERLPDLHAKLQRIAELD